MIKVSLPVVLPTQITLPKRNIKQKQPSTLLQTNDEILNG